MDMSAQFVASATTQGKSSASGASPLAGFTPLLMLIIVVAIIWMVVSLFRRRPDGSSGPTTHFFATPALCLGLIGLCTANPSFPLGLSMIASVAAILLGHQASKKIDADPGRLAGIGKAQAGILLGWVGCAMFAFSLGHNMGVFSTLAGIGGIALGVAAIAGAVVLRKKWARGALQIAAIGSSPALLVVGGVWGIADARADAVECKQDETSASQLAEKNVSAARQALNAARAKCPDTESAFIAELERNIVRWEQVAQKAAAERSAAEQAAAAAANEQQAVQTFPQKSTEIAASYKRALNDTYAGRWADADKDLSGAETALSSFNGTSVAQSKPYQDLGSQFGALRKKIDAQLQQIEKQQAAKEAAQAAADAKVEKPAPCAKLARTFGAGSALTDLQKDEAWKQYQGQYFQWDLKVTEVVSGPLGGIHVSAECANWPDLWPIQIEYDDATWARQLTKDTVWRLKGKLRSMTLGILIADGCTRSNCQ